MFTLPTRFPDRSFDGVSPISGSISPSTQPAHLHLTNGISPSRRRFRLRNGFSTANQLATANTSEMAMPSSHRDISPAVNAVEGQQLLHGKGIDVHPVGKVSVLSNFDNRKSYGQPEHEIGPRHLTDAD